MPWFCASCAAYSAKRALASGAVGIPYLVSSSLQCAATLAVQPSQPPTPKITASAFCFSSAHISGSSTNMMPFLCSRTVFTPGMFRENHPTVSSRNSHPRQTHIDQYRRFCPGSYRGGAPADAAEPLIVGCPLGSRTAVNSADVLLARVVVIRILHSPAAAGLPARTGCRTTYRTLCGKLQGTKDRQKSNIFCGSE